MNKLILLAAVFCLSFQTKKSGYNLPKHFVFIPSGSSENDGKEYSVNAFYMLDHEVTNFEYLEFVKDLVKEGNKEDLKKALPDTLLWNELGWMNQPMVDHYFRHPAYAEYPVVNVSKEAANLFCKWLTLKIRKENSLLVNDFRLPTRMEWMYAASAGNKSAIYSWIGHKLENEEGEKRANFFPIGDENITQDPDGKPVITDTLYQPAAFDDAAFVTVPKGSYEPNEFGLYNMSGNVSEMVAKEDVVVGGDWLSPGFDIRVESKRKAKEKSPRVGFRPVVSYIVPN